MLSSWLYVDKEAKVFITLNGVWEFKILVLSLLIKRKKCETVVLEESATLERILQLYLNIVKNF